MGFYWILLWVVVLLDSPIRRRFAIKMSVEFAIEDLGTMLAAVSDQEARRKPLASATGSS
jgi:hypothetical protein